MLRGLNLVVPDKPDPERDQVASAWEDRGGLVTRIGRFWDPPPLEARLVRIYGNDTFALVLAQKLELSLISPSDDLLAKLPSEVLLRQLRIISLSEAATLTFPIFIKPVVPKQFAARVYASHAALASECAGLEPAALIYVSEVVSFTAEARAFILDGAVQDIALYEGEGVLGDAHRVAGMVSGHESLPPTCVLDVGYIEGRGWAVIEANATWGAGLNGCSPEKVVECIARATVGAV